MADTSTKSPSSDGSRNRRNRRRIGRSGIPQYGQSPRLPQQPSTSGESLKDRFNNTDSLYNRTRGRTGPRAAQPESEAKPETGGGTTAAPNNWAAPDASTKQGTTDQPKLNSWDAPAVSTKNDSLPAPTATPVPQSSGVYDDQPRGGLQGMKDKMGFDDSLYSRLRNRGKNKEDNGAVSPESLKEKENAPGGGWNTNIPGAEKGVGGLGEKSKIDAKGNVFQRNKRGFGLGGAAAGLLIFFLLMLLPFSALKVVHFGEVMAAASYARFNDMMVQRTTQDIFDASTVEGEGSVTVRGQTIVDKLKFRNIDNQLAEIGRRGDLKFTLDKGELKAVKIGEKSISTDEISQKFFGKSYDELGKLSDLRARARVRYEYTNQLESAVGDTFKTEAKFVRGRLFDTIADKVGFKFSGWQRQNIRDFIGKSPVEAAAEDTVDSIEATTKDLNVPGISSEIEDIIDKSKDPDKLREFIIKHNGNFGEAEQALWQQTINLEKVSRIQEVASNVGFGVLVASLACITHEAFDHVGDVAKNNQIASQRAGLNGISSSDQIKVGGAPPEAIAARAHNLDKADQSPYYQHFTNQPVTSTASIPKLEPDTGSNIAGWVATLTKPTNILGPGRIALDVAGALPFVPSSDDIDKAFCDTLLSPAGAITFAVGEIVIEAVVAVVSGGTSEIGEVGMEQLALKFVQGLGSALKDKFSIEFATDFAKTAGAIGLYSVAMNLAASFLSSFNFSGAGQGADGFTEGAIGNSIGQSYRERTLGAAPMTTDEAHASDEAAQVVLQEKWQQKGPFDRYLAIDNPYSLIGSVAATTPTSMLSLSGSIRSGAANIGSLFSPSQLGKLFSPLFNIGSQKVAAASDFNPYQTTQWGWTIEEQQKLALDPAFSLVDNFNHISEADITALDAQIGKCFDPSRQQYDVDRDSDCSRDKLGHGSDAAYNDKVLHYRVARFLDPGVADTMSTSLVTNSNSNAGFTVNRQTTPATASNANIFVLGDSITVGMNASSQGANSISNRLGAAGWIPTIDAQGCRMLYVAGGSTPGDPAGKACPKGTITDAFTEFNANKAAISQSGAIVIALGTNKYEGGDEIFRSKIDEFIGDIRQVNASAPIYWVNVYNRSGKLDNRSKIIQDQSPGKYRVIDLRSEIIAHPDQYPFADDTLDQVHRTSTGYSNEAAFIVQQVGKAPTSTTGFAPTMTRTTCKSSFVSFFSSEKDCLVSPTGNQMPLSGYAVVGS